MSAETLISAILRQEENSVDDFLEMISKKIEDSIDIKKVEVASSMFAEAKGECPECQKSNKECECDDEEDDEEEDKDEKMDEEAKDKIKFGVDVPFAGPYRRTGSVKKDKFGNVIKPENMAKHLAKQGMAGIRKEEVEQIDELSKGTLSSYVGKAMAQSNRKKATALQLLKKGGSPNRLDMAAKHLNKAVKRRHGVDKAVDKLGGGAKIRATEETMQANEMTDRVTVDKVTTELGRGKGLPPKVTSKKIVVDKAAMDKLGTIQEMAPPGAKYERMVKHIKKGYSKNGNLTDKEKSIAYATAWKAKNKKTMKEEISDTQKMSALGMKGSERSSTINALRAYRKHGDINKLSPGHRTLVASYAEKTGGLSAVNRSAAMSALKKEKS